MDPMLQSQTVFHLTGKRPTVHLESLEELELRPALLARYRDLTRLRYDFPLILIDGTDECFVRSLSDVVDEFVQTIAPAGIEGESLRKHVLRIEHEIRSLIAGGTTGSLSSLWAEAVSRLTATATESIAEVLRHAGDALAVDGELLDCEPSTARRLITHAWRTGQERKSRRSRADLNALIVRLSDILRAEFVRSEAGRRPESLKAALGPSHQELFDFDVMARLLALSTPGKRLSPARRQRIEWALAALRAQRFFAPAAGSLEVSGSPEPYAFDFESSDAVLASFRERLPAMVELVKAMAIAELETDGRYVEATHDGFFEAFDENSLGPNDLEQFPDYLLCLNGASRAVSDHTALMELLSSGVPVKVLVESEDILEESSLGQGQLAFGVRSVQLASLATGLDDTFVLQSTSSNLYRLRDSISRGLAWPQSTLFSVYTGCAGAARVPVYLMSAAAMQSRAFPAFTYDPGAGADLAARFSLEDNPDAQSDWSIAPFEYADENLERHEERLAFTFADFVLCDRRYARHFARVPPDAWNGHLLPVAEWLARPATETRDKVPCLLAVDQADVLQKVVIDEKLVRAVRRCRETWHRLQELGGIHNSHAERLLARERAAWETERKRELASAPAADAEAPADASQTAAAAAVVEPAATVEVAEAERPAEEPWIETSRCSSCNECTQINDHMFAYNENKQAYIKDVSAGTYRELVEAAESCQLAIIHPGKPRDPNEPGLEELLERAQKFL